MSSREIHRSAIIDAGGMSTGTENDAKRFAWLDAVSWPSIVVTDDGKICRVNPFAVALFGADEKDLKGVPLRDLIAPRSRAVVEKPGDGRITVVRRGETPVETEVDWHSATFVFDDAVCTLHTFRERPERVDFAATADGDGGGESKLAAIYQLVFDQIPIGLLHFDHRGVITACNDALVAIIGSSKRVLVGLDMQTLASQPIVNAVRTALTGERAHWEGDYQSVTGRKTTPARVDFSPVRDAQGRIVGGVGIIEDVTARREAEMALRRSEAQLAQLDRMASVGILAAGVAHEINNPLTYVITSLDHARDQLTSLRQSFDPSIASQLTPLETSLSNARDGVDRVRMIVRDLRAFSRGDTGPMSPVDVERVLDSAINVAANAIRGKARLVREYAGVSPVLGDPARLGQVFTNLLVNAGEAIPEGGADRNRIRVTTSEASDGWITIEIADSGGGVPNEVVSRIFEPFVTTKSPGEGTGLGLAICHGLVKNMRGEITLASTGPSGSTFRVRLPKARDTSAPPRSSRPPKGKGPRLRILVIEDEAILASTLRLALGDRHDIVIANSGTKGLETLATDKRFDVVLCDVMMPDRSGMDVFETVEAEFPELAPRFVFMTGGTFSARADAFFARITNPRIEKPFSMDEIDSLLKRIGSGG
jgi:PAS domain S-box-containing protein